MHEYAWNAVILIFYTNLSAGVHSGHFVGGLHLSKIRKQTRQGVCTCEQTNERRGNLIEYIEHMYSPAYDLSCAVINQC